MAFTYKHTQLNPYIYWRVNDSCGLLKTCLQSKESTFLLLSTAGSFLPPYFCPFHCLQRTADSVLSAFIGPFRLLKCSLKLLLRGAFYTLFLCS